MRKTPILFPIARWVARIIAIILGIFLMMFIIGEGFMEGGGVPPAYVLLPFWVILAGFVVGWRYEGAGALMLLAMFIYFNVMELRANGHLLRLGAFHLLLVPGSLFFIAWCERWWNHERGEGTSAKGVTAS